MALRKSINQNNILIDLCLVNGNYSLNFFFGFFVEWFHLNEKKIVINNDRLIKLKFERKELQQQTTTTKKRIWK